MEASMLLRTGQLKRKPILLIHPRGFDLMLIECIYITAFTANDLSSA